MNGQVILKILCGGGGGGGKVCQTIGKNYVKNTCYSSLHSRRSVCTAVPASCKRDLSLPVVVIIRKCVDGTSSCRVPSEFRAKKSQKSGCHAGYSVDLELESFENKSFHTILVKNLF